MESFSSGKTRVARIVGRGWWVASALGFALGCSVPTRAAVLYNIGSFDPNDATTSSSTTVMYDASLPSITVAPGLTGTSASDLATLQTLNSNATSGTTGTRFQNTDIDAAQTNGTLIEDASTNGYFQFGIAGGAGQIGLDSLTFQASRATTTATSIRGYSVSVSVNGGAYSALAAANVTSLRGGGFDSISIPLTDPSFQGVSSVDFRVQATGGGIEYTNFAINGSVPEPASLGLIGLTAGLILRRRRTA